MAMLSVPELSMSMPGVKRATSTTSLMSRNASINAWLC
jgi:hypothetical protein